jgi:cytoskeletal protein CcmA (bactofilin family)
MAKVNDHKGNERIRTTLGKETDFNGTMKFKDSLKIIGKFKGEIVSPGFLYIENGAEVKANIKVGSVIIGGVVKGNVIAKEKLEMLETGKVFGNIKTAKLKIADGVVFEGKCEMIKNPEKIDIFSENVDEIKKNIEYVSSTE